MEWIHTLKSKLYLCFLQINAAAPSTAVLEYIHDIKGVWALEPVPAMFWKSWANLVRRLTLATMDGNWLGSFDYLAHGLRKA